MIEPIVWLSLPETLDDVVMEIASQTRQHRLVPKSAVSRGRPDPRNGL